MADIEKEKDAPPSAEDDSRSTVRDLVKNAGAAFDFLSNEGCGEAAQTVESVEEQASAAEASASSETALEAATPEVVEETVMAAGDSEGVEAVEAAPAPKAKKSRKGGKKKGTVESVEWSAEAANLDFVEPKVEARAGEAVADEEGLSAFEALARRIAETVSRNEESGEEVAEVAAESATSESVEDSWQASADEVESLDEENTDEPSAADLIAAELAAAASAEESMEGAASEETVQVIEAAASEGSEGEMEQMGFSSMEEEEKADDDSSKEPTEFIEADQLVSIIESLLFSTDKPVSIATIKQIFKGSNVRTKDITRAIDMLASEYASAQRGVTLEEINGGYQLRTKSDNADYLRRLAKVRPFRLSGPALEVMSIVAYKQPITKHEIDEIRGVESGHLLRALMERGLINFNGKSDLPGKPMTYGSTRKFLEIFGLRNLKELPTLSEIDELLPEGIGEEQEKETLSDLTERMSTELTSTYSEGEDELLKINAQLQDIDTTTEFFEQEKQRERDRRDRERAQDIREKLVLGDAVDEKDRKWLDRYEAKLAQQEAAAQAGTPMVVSADEMDAEPQIGGQLEALSAEAQANMLEHEIAGELSEIDEALMSDGEAMMDDDLSANLDYDEDADKNL